MVRCRSVVTVESVARVLNISIPVRGAAIPSKVNKATFFLETIQLSCGRSIDKNKLVDNVWEKSFQMNLRKNYVMVRIGEAAGVGDEATCLNVLDVWMQ